MSADVLFIPVAGTNKATTHFCYLRDDKNQLPVTEQAPNAHLCAAEIQQVGSTRRLIFISL